MDRLDAVRKHMKTQGVTAYLVPMRDQWGNEYVPEHDRTLQWLTGFTGSNGFAIVMQERAAFFTDGRYILQMEHEVSDAWQRYNMSDTTPHAWLGEQLTAQDSIGFDGFRFTTHGLKTYTNIADNLGATCRDVGDLISSLWVDRPAPPQSPAFLHDSTYAGTSFAEKTETVEAALAKHGAHACLLCDSTSINWLLNIRGGDFPHTPVVNASAIYQNGRITLYTAPTKMTAIAAQLPNVVVQPTHQITQDLAQCKQPILIDPASTPHVLYQAVEVPQRIKADDPCALAKACKNDVEQQGMRDCHVIDGVAMVRFLCWLEQQVESATLDELAVIDQLAAFRAEGDLFHSLSFDTIAGFGSNGAIIHYRADEAQNKAIESGSLLLVDSGGQYLNGTTDVTRTIAIGTPTDAMRNDYTLVLKGHIALARAVFPRGTTGHMLDTLARAPLWQQGKDYAHGAGHGVGYMLNVHEGPQNISGHANRQPLLPGMVTSNEPGYYKAGDYGIRIESLVLTVEHHRGEADKEMFRFETLTLVPFDRALIDVALLKQTELDWINHYHQHVYDRLHDRLDTRTAAWLKDVTSPLV